MYPFPDAPHGVLRRQAQVGAVVVEEQGEHVGLGRVRVHALPAGVGVDRHVGAQRVHELVVEALDQRVATARPAVGERQGAAVGAEAAQREERDAGKPGHELDRPVERDGGQGGVQHAVEIGNLDLRARTQRTTLNAQIQIG